MNYTSVNLKKRIAISNNTKLFEVIVNSLLRLNIILSIQREEIQRFKDNS